MITGPRHPPPFHMTKKRLSLSRRGAWGQVAIAAILITVLPALIIVWACLCRLNGISLSPAVALAAGGGGVSVILLGYTLLLKYPVSIVRLRSYLRTLAGGGIPELVPLSNDEDDLDAVQRYMEIVVKMAEDRIRMLKTQYDVELELERQRVMVESIGAMCHHVSQPATVMSMCLHCLRDNPSPEQVLETLNEFEKAYNAMAEMLEKLRLTSYYCAESYLTPSNVDVTKIIKV